MGANAGALRAGKAFVEFFLKDGALRKGLGRVEKQCDAIGGKLRSLGKIGIGIGTGIAAGFALPIKAASDLEETMNKFNVVFGDNAATMKAWGDEYAATIGRSEKQVAEFLGNSQDLFVPLGFEPGAAAELSKQVTGLAFDLASFNNIADDDAIRDLHAALTGSGEVMKKYGVVLSETAVQQELINQGFDPKKATEQQKVQARLAIIMKGTAAAQGDAVRSAGGFANQVKGLTGVLFDTAAAIGNAVLPMVTAFVSIVRENVRAVGDWIEKHPALIQGIAIAAGVITALGAVLFAAGVAFQVVGFAAAGLSAALGIVTAVIGFIASPLGIIVSLGAGVAVAFATMTETGRAMTSSLGAWFGGLWTIASETFTAISTALAAGDIEAAAAVLWSALTLLWLQGTQGIRETWHSFVGAIMKAWHTLWAGMQQLGNVVWGNIERGWSHTAEFFGTLWDTAINKVANLFTMMTTGMQRALNKVLGWFQYAWGYITGATDDELARITAETDAADEILRAEGQKTRDDRNNGVANRAAERNAAAAAAREESRQNQATRLDEIGADLARNLDATDDGTQAKIDEAQKRLDEARGAWGVAKDAAAAAGEAKKTDEKKAATVGGAIAANGAAGEAAGKGTSIGSFSADAAMRMMQGGGIEEKMLDVEEQMLATLGRIERKPGGGLKAGA